MALHRNLAVCLLQGSLIGTFVDPEQGVKIVGHGSISQHCCPNLDTLTGMSTVNVSMGEVSVTSFEVRSP